VAYFCYVNFWDDYLTILSEPLMQRNHNRFGEKKISSDLTLFYKQLMPLLSLVVYIIGLVEGNVISISLGGIFTASFSILSFFLVDAWIETESLLIRRFKGLIRIAYKNIQWIREYEFGKLEFVVVKIGTNQVSGYFIILGSNNLLFSDDQTEIGKELIDKLKESKQIEHR
jgi:hypothetical protein